MKLEMRYPDPSGTTEESEKIEGCKIGTWKKKVSQNKHCEGVREQKWQGKLHTARWVVFPSNYYSVPLKIHQVHPL